MAESFKTQDGKTVKSGDKCRLVLTKGSDETRDRSERTVEGIVRAFEHHDRMLDDEGYAVKKITRLVWEISTGNPAHPAIGFLPENVKTRGT